MILGPLKYYTLKPYVIIILGLKPSIWGLILIHGHIIFFEQQIFKAYVL